MSLFEKIISSSPATYNSIKEWRDPAKGGEVWSLALKSFVCEAEG